MTSTRLRRAVIFASVIWVILALMRLTAWIAGNPGNPVALAFWLLAGVVGVVVLAVALIPRRGQR